MTTSMTGKFGQTNKSRTNNDPFYNDIKLDINEGKLNDYRKFISLSNDSRAIKDMYMLDPNYNRTTLSLRPIAPATPKFAIPAQPLPKMKDSSSFGSINERFVAMNPRLAPIDQAKRETFMEKCARERVLCASNHDRVINDMRSSYHDFCKALSDNKMKTLSDFLAKPAKLHHGPSAEARQFYDKFITSSSSA